MKNTKIEWCDHTVNFWWGCTFAHYLTGQTREECEHCYALMLAKLFSKGKATWGPQGNRWLRENKAMAEINKLDASAARRGVRERVFVNSMSDTFEDRRDLDGARTLLWLAAHAVTNLDLLLLTKRPQNVARMVPAHWMAGHWPAHVWLGCTAGTQQAANECLPRLLNIPARVRFLSCEPMLGPVDIEENLDDLCDGGYVLGSAPIHWVICGGESGPKARPMHPDWARSLRDQCAAAGVPFHFKQWGEWAPAVEAYGTTGHVMQEGTGDRYRWIGWDGKTQNPSFHGLTSPIMAIAKVGKSAAGRLLDGKEHNEFPTP